MLHFFPEKLTFELVTIAFCLLVLVEGRPVPSANNITIVGANNNDPNVHCQPTTWYDICWFIFANYILHALSVRSLPGENAYSSLVFKTGCLLIPYTGLRRGLCLISRASNCVGNELQGAARASALCMVIRSSDWRPYPGDEVEGCEVDLQRELAVGKVKADPEKRSGDGTEVEASSRSGTGNAKGLRIKLKDLYTAPPRHGIIDRITGWVVETHRFQISTPSASIVDHKSVNIHGRCELSPGYGLSYIPGDMKVYPRTISNVSTRSASETRVACVQGFPRILFSVVM